MRHKPPRCFPEWSDGSGCGYLRRRLPSCQKATALAAATFKESTPWDMGIRTV